MDIEFDPAKDALNREKHGVSLAFGAELFDDPEHIVLPSMRPIDGEDRYKVVGAVDGRLWTAVHVIRGDARRFISVRKSNDGEERIYRADG
ncbi:BrnT family toxin [Sphingomonas citri]